MYKYAYSKQLAAKILPLKIVSLAMSVAQLLPEVSNLVSQLTEHLA